MFNRSINQRMRLIMGLILLSTLLLAPVAGSAGELTARGDALMVLIRLRQQGIWLKDSPEYRSVEECFAQGEKLMQQGKDEAADQMFHLALVKGALLEKRQGGQVESIPSHPASAGGKGEVVALPAVAAPRPAGQSDSITAPLTEVENVLQEYSTVKPRQKPAQSSPPVGTEPSPAEQAEVIASDRIIGGKSVYTVSRGESLRLISAKLGVDVRYLAKLNGITTRTPLKIGQKLVVNTRRIIPKKMTDGIVINIPDRTLYLFRKGVLNETVPVALGKTTAKEKSAWNTPIGTFRIIAKIKDPTWRVPPSIQKEMEAQGMEVVAEIPPGEKNPLGRYALRTSIPGILIHSTLAPSSIYGFSSHGCIRIFPSRMEELFGQVQVNTRGEIIYRPVKVAATRDGRVFLEVHRDIYDKTPGLEQEVKEQLKKLRVEDRVDWRKVNPVLQGKWGVAEDVSL